MSSLFESRSSRSQEIQRGVHIRVEFESTTTHSGLVWPKVFAQASQRCGPAFGLRAGECKAQFFARDGFPPALCIDR